VFKKLKARVTGGGTTVETTLQDPNVRPGGQVGGEVHIVGGEVEQEIAYLAVSLTARVEVETEDSEYDANVTFAEKRLTDRWELKPGDEHRHPFTLTVPIETPFNAYGGQRIPGVSIGVRTELEIARSLDRGDVDPLQIHPLPAQQRVLDAFLALGFRIKAVDLERGTIAGGTLPFYQEIELAPPQQYRAQLNELELTFVSRHEATDVILEADKRGGLFSEGRDSFRRFTVEHAEVDRLDVETLLQHHLQEIARKRGIFG
jgi:sporulation-control protein